MLMSVRVCVCVCAHIHDTEVLSERYHVGVQSCVRVCACIHIHNTGSCRGVVPFDRKIKNKK